MKLIHKQHDGDNDSKNNDDNTVVMTMCFKKKQEGQIICLQHA